MAFSPATGLVYLPVKVGTQFLHAPDPEWMYDPAANNVGMDNEYDGPLRDELEALPPATGFAVTFAQKTNYAVTVIGE